jgi:hypothetical protein
MSNKMYPPLGNTPHKISQSTHGENASNPSDLSKQQAVDISANGNAPLYAVWDGVIVNAVNSGTGSYFALDIGLPFYVLYVHATADLPKGTAVKRGQKIGRVFPMTGSHLHFGFKNKNGSRPTDNPMEYLQRDMVRYFATHPDIIKLWCLPTGDIKWDLFVNKTIGATSPPPALTQGSKLKVKVINIRLRESKGTSAKIIRLLDVGETIEVVNDNYPLSGGYYWLQVSTKDGGGWTAYQTDWFEIVKDDCQGKLSEASKTIETLQGELSQREKIIKNFKATLAEYMDSELKHLERVGYLDSKLHTAQESVEKYRQLNSKMIKENQEAQLIIDSRDNVGWALSNLLSAIRKALKRFE